MATACINSNDLTDQDEQVSNSLSQLFLRIWVVVLLLILLGGGVLLFLQSYVDLSSMHRDGYQRRPRGLTGSSAWPHDWPAPKHWALFKGPLPFVSSVYAVSWDTEGNKYFVDAVVVELPASVVYKRKTRVLKKQGIVNPALPTDWVTRYNIDPTSLLIHSLLYTTVVWVLIGALPAAAEHSHERELQRQRERELMCLHCQYDIQDLPICPECGNPSHRV